jgi:hypothetical protein
MAFLGRDTETWYWGAFTDGLVWVEQIRLPGYCETITRARRICFAIQSDGFRETLVADVALFSCVTVGSFLKDESSMWGLLTQGQTGSEVMFILKVAIMSSSFRLICSID